MRWGRLRAESVGLELPEGAVLSDVQLTVDGTEVPAEPSQDGRRVTLSLPPGRVIEAGSTNPDLAELVVCTLGGSRGSHRSYSYWASDPRQAKPLERHSAPAARVLKDVGRWSALEPLN